MNNSISRRIIEYRASKTLAEFHQSNEFVRGLVGPVGSGKSTGCAVEIFRRANEQAPDSNGIRKSRWLVARNTYRELADTTVQTWLDWFPEDDFGPMNKQDMVHSIRAGDMQTDVLFRALDRPDDVKKLLSLDLTGGWLNEAREFPKAVVDMLQTRVGRYPSKRAGGPTWFGLFADTNPPDTDSWWYRLFEEQRPEGFKLFRQPSGLAQDAENIENLPRDYYPRLLHGKTDDWIKVYVHGEYGYVQDGKPVYPEFRSSVHVAREVLRPIPGATVYVGVDFGLTPAAVFGQRDVLGRWRWLSELVAQDMGAVRFGEQLKRELLTKYAGYAFECYGDPAGDGRSQVDERTAFEALEAAGVPSVPAPSNDFVKRREAVAGAMNRLIDGEPGMVVSPECKTAIKGMAGGYRYKRVLASGEERFHDKPEKNHFSHVCDAGQYMMLGAGETMENLPDDGWSKKLVYTSGVYV